MVRFLVLALCLFLSLPLQAAEKKKADEALPPVTPKAAPIDKGVEKTAEKSAPVGTPGAKAQEPDISGIPFIQNLKNIGARIYYLGQSLGMDGWFAIKDRQVQILYTTPDKRAVLVGALLTADGANISQQQVMMLASNNPEIQELIKGVPTSNPVAVDAAKDAARAVNPAPAPASVPAVSDAATGADTSPSATFYDALLKAAGLTFGKDSAPLLVMIMDVNCTYCHRTWKNLQPLVDAEKLRVRFIPIGALGAQSEMQAANWLGKPDPYDAWKRHVAGDETIFKAGAPDPERQALIAGNTQLIRKWGVDQTPTLLYKGQNGKVRMVVGEPKDVSLILGDMAPAK
jgi:protein-disulfide isomerase